MHKYKFDIGAKVNCYDGWELPEFTGTVVNRRWNDVFEFIEYRIRIGACDSAMSYFRDVKETQLEEVKNET